MREWQVGRRLEHPLRRDTDGQLVLPLWIGRDGEAVGVSELVLTTAEAEQPHAALC